MLIDRRAGLDRGGDPAHGVARSVIAWPLGSGRLSARAPGQMPRMPTPLAGAAATVETAVPWKSVTAGPPAVAMFEPASSRVADVDHRVDDADQRAGRGDGGRDRGADHEVAPPRLRRERVGRRRLGAPRRAGWARPRRAGRAPAARRPGRRARSRGASQAVPAISRAPCARAIRARGGAAGARADDPGRRVRADGGGGDVAGQAHGRGGEGALEIGAERRGRGRDQRRRGQPAPPGRSDFSRS